MSWYLKAKLIDKGDPVDKNIINAQCMYCGRWATNPNTSKASREETIWKQNDQLDKEEILDVRKTKKEINHVTHGICDFCLGVMEKIRGMGRNPLKYQPHHIRELSLGLRTDFV